MDALAGAVEGREKMTEELMGKMISALEALKTDLYSIKISLIMISICLAFCVGVVVVKVLRKDD